MSYQRVTTDEQLAVVCQKAQTKSVVMLDTEFVRTKTYFPQLGLIQLNDGEVVSLIDPVDIQDMTPLKELLMDVSVLKVLHACSEDLDVFIHRFGVMPEPMLDTQVLASFLGYGSSIGFAALVEDIVGITLDKGESRSDWLARPLTQSQLSYAKDDVKYLFPIYDYLVKKAQRDGWYTQAYEESQLIVESRRVANDKGDSSQAYRQIKLAWKLSGVELARLQLLAQWREQEAIRRDLALNFVIKEQELFQLAELGSDNLNQLKQLDIHPSVIRRHGDKILSLIQQANQWPTHKYPQKVVNASQHPSYKKLLARLKEKVKEMSQQTNLPPELLGSNKLINSLILWKVEHHFSVDHKPTLAKGWRAQLFEERLTNILHNTY